MITLSKTDLAAVGGAVAIVLGASMIAPGLAVMAAGGLILSAAIVGHLRCSLKPSSGDDQQQRKT